MKSPDYEEFVALCNAHEARYLIVGAHAFAFHARPRATKDLDIWVDPQPDNATRVLSVIREFLGGVDLGISVADLTRPGQVIQLGIAPTRIDLLTRIAGLPSFEEAWRGKIEATYGAAKAFYLCREHLIRAKQAADRPQDRADLEDL